MKIRPKLSPAANSFPQGEWHNAYITVYISIRSDRINFCNIKIASCRTLFPMREYINYDLSPTIKLLLYIHEVNKLNTVWWWYGSGSIVNKTQRLLVINWLTLWRILLLTRYSGILAVLKRDYNIRDY